MHIISVCCVFTITLVTLPTASVSPSVSSPIVPVPHPQTFSANQLSRATFSERLILDPLYAINKAVLLQLNIVKYSSARTAQKTPFIVVASPGSRKTFRSTVWKSGDFLAMTVVYGIFY
jgi:hypothetical protein